MSVLDQIVKAYDIRGTVHDELNAAVAHALGVGFATFVRSQQVRRVVVARDMRPSGPGLVEAFTRGLTEHGVDVVDIGLASTDLMYYASGRLDVPGAMFTASHNPAGYNGVKLCMSGARPVGADTGLAEIKSTAQLVLDGTPPSIPDSEIGTGQRTEMSLLDEFVEQRRRSLGVKAVIVGEVLGRGHAEGSGRTATTRMRPAVPPNPRLPSWNASSSPLWARRSTVCRTARSVSAPCVTARCGLTAST